MFIRDQREKRWKAYPTELLQDEKGTLEHIDRDTKEIRSEISKEGIVHALKIATDDKSPGTDDLKSMYLKL